MYDMNLLFIRGLHVSLKTIIMRINLMPDIALLLQILLEQTYKYIRQ